LAAACGGSLRLRPAAELLAPLLDGALRDLMKLKPPQLLDERYRKFRRMGVFEK
jgi:acetyl-CoA carboxylase alpha subunit